MQYRITLKIKDMRIKTVLMTLAAAFVCNVCVMAQAVSPQGELTPEEQRIRAEQLEQAKLEKQKAEQLLKRRSRKRRRKN